MLVSVRRVAAVASITGFLGVAAARADRFASLETADDAARVRVDLIRRAERSIDATYFIVGDDSVSLAVLSLLRDAARRGISVRLLVDAQFNRIPYEIQAHLVGEGVRIREYHPFRLTRPRWWTRRLHDKLLLVDRATLVTGGRNIESPYYGRGEEVGRRDYVDRDALVEGEAAREAAEYFDALWSGSKVRKTDLSRFKPSRLGRRCELLLDEPDRARCERLKALSREELASVGPLLDRQRDLLDREPLFSSPRPLPETREVGPIRFLHDPPGGKRAGTGIGTELLSLLDRAERSVVIESPYLVPSRALKAALLRAKSRGVGVRILTNSLAVTDNLLAQAGYAGRKDDVLEYGVELWEYTGPECLHAKSAVVDDRFLVIGSFNLDPRSEHLNTEVAVVVDDPESATRVREDMDAHLAHAVRIGPGGKPLPGGHPAPPVGCGKRAKLFFLRLLAPFIQDQL